MRLDARVVIWRTADRAFKIGAQAGVWIPTGNSRLLLRRRRGERQPGRRAGVRPQEEGDLHERPGLPVQALQRGEQLRRAARAPLRAGRAVPAARRRHPPGRRALRVRGHRRRRPRLEQPHPGRHLPRREPPARVDGRGPLPGGREEAHLDRRRRRHPPHRRLLARLPPHGAGGLLLQHRGHGAALARPALQAGAARRPARRPRPRRHPGRRRSLPGRPGGWKAAEPGRRVPGAPRPRRRRHPPQHRQVPRRGHRRAPGRRRLPRGRRRQGRDPPTRRTPAPSSRASRTPIRRRTAARSSSAASAARRRSSSSRTSSSRRARR